jgi:hypothetical protein
VLHLPPLPCVFLCPKLQCAALVIFYYVLHHPPFCFVFFVSKVLTCNILIISNLFSPKDVKAW